jgi:hypothetical protein
MKKGLLILCLSALGATPCLAQVPPPQEDPAVAQARQDKIKGLKLAYILQQLNISKEEESRFVPLYFQYDKEVTSTNHNLALDEITREETILNIRKRYQDQFTAVLGRNRAIYFFRCERDFNQMLIKRLRPAPRMGPLRRGY